MNNTAIIEFGFRRIWRILQISEGVIHLGLRPLWITPSLICRILHIPLSLIPNLLNIFEKSMVTLHQLQRAHCSINWIKCDCFYSVDATDWGPSYIKSGNMRFFLAWANSPHVHFERSDSVLIYLATFSLYRNITRLSCVCLSLCSSRHFCDRTNSLHLIL